MHVLYTSIFEWLEEAKPYLNDIEKILVADRGFGSYNFYLHAEGIGAFYLVRITESRARSMLGTERFAELGEPFDVTVTRHLVRHHRKSEHLHQDCLDDYRVIPSSTQFDFLKHGKSGEIPLTVRIVRVKIKEGMYEYLATNLGRAEFPILAIKEIWSRMILYNFCMEIVNQVTLKKQGCKYVYRINIAQTLKTCMSFSAPVPTCGNPWMSSVGSSRPNPAQYGREGISQGKRNTKGRRASIIVNPKHIK